MKDLESILSELKPRATDAAHEMELVHLCREIITTFETSSAQGVANLIETRIKGLEESFNSAFEELLRKMSASGEGGDH